MRLVIALALAPLLTGCAMGSAKIWAQDTTGGILALNGDEGKAMEDADKKMAAHCGLGNYMIVRRETVVVGKENYENTQYGEREDTAQASAQAGESTTEHGESTDTTVQGGSSQVAVPGGTYQSGAASSSTQSGGYQTTSGSSAQVAQGTRETQGGSSRVSGVRDVTETRVHYQCRSGQPQYGQPPAPVAPAPAPQP